MSPLVRRTLQELLTLAPQGTDTWTAPTPGEFPPRLYGGQVAAQSLAAAAHTVDSDRLVHSLHGYFIRPGRPEEPLELVVERTRDGRSFTTRHVTAVQEGKAIFNLTASFHRPEPGIDWQAPPPVARGPDEALRMPAESPFRLFWESGPFEIRPISAQGPHPCWVRIVETLAPGPAVQACALTYISDMAVAVSARAPGEEGELAFLASLDHAVWFHRPFDMAEWHLFKVEPVSNSGARGLAVGSLHARDGRLVASVAQEALIRPT